MGPDGALYVSLLTGAPFTPGAAGIYRVDPGQGPGQVPELYQGDFKTVIDFAFGPDGSLYVLEHSIATTFPPIGTPGRLTKIAPDGTQTEITRALNRPTSVIVDEDGVIYVSNNGVSAGTGEVLKIVP